MAKQKIVVVEGPSAMLHCIPGVRQINSAPGYAVARIRDDGCCTEVAGWVSDKWVAEAIAELARGVDIWSWYD